MVAGIVGPALHVGVGGTPAYQVSRSLRGRAANSNYMNRTPGVAGNQQKGTFSFWAKRTRIGTFDPVLCATGNHSYIGFSQSGVAGLGTDEFGLSCNGAGNVWSKGVYRDQTDWAHYVCAWDTTQAVAANRVRLYVNGVEVFYDASSAYPTQNTNIDICGANAHNLWRYVTGAYVAEIMLAQVALVDGQQLTPSSFAQTDAITGQWVPKDLSTGITWGTTGFWLKFADNSSVANLGTDSSANGNTWTVNGFSVTAGTANDSLTDVPTNYGNDTGLGGEVRGNFCTLFSTPTTGASDGNLKINSGYAADVAPIYTTHAVTSGKWYWEMNCVNIATYPYVGIGVTNLHNSNTNYFWQAGWGVRASGASTGTANAACPSGPTENLTGISFATSDVLMFALDMDNKKFFIGKNGTWFNSANPVSGTNPQLTWTGTHEIWPMIYTTSAGGGGLGSYMNFGQRPFNTAAPSGFKCICAQNLSDPAILDPKKHFNAITYLGNGGSQFIGDPIPQPLYSYQVANSLRFQRANTTQMTKTFGSASGRQKFTLSLWYKRSLLTQSNDSYLFGAGTAAAAQNIGFSQTQGGGDAFFFQDTNNTWCLVSNKKFRDVQNWHHLVFAVDTTQATATNRIRVYDDGVEITSWATDNRSASIAQNALLSWGNNVVHALGAYSGNTAATATYNPDVYMAQVAFVDGQQLTPATFGQSDANGNWIPKDLTSGITWGTNGFLLTFSNTSSTANLGLDSSGNSNTFTTSGFSVTAGTTNDALTDVPSAYGADTGAGGEVRGNYPTWNPLEGAGATTDYGNLRSTGSGVQPKAMLSTPFDLPKVYFEMTGSTQFNANYPMVGIAEWNSTTQRPANANNDTSSGANWAFAYAGASIALRYNRFGVLTDTSFTFGGVAANDVIGIAYEKATGKVWFRRNGTWVNSGDPANGTNPTMIVSFNGPVAAMHEAYSSSSVWLNMGQRPFANAAPSGFKAPCAANAVPDSEIVSTPDIAWIKGRSGATTWVQANSVVGAGSYMSTPSTSGDTIDANSILGFTFNGINIGNASVLNTLASTYVSYLFNKSATCGIDVVNYAGDNTANRNISHSLGAAPTWALVKSRSTSDWWYYNQAFGGATFVCRMDLSGSASGIPTTTNTPWGTGNWSSTQFMVTNNATNNANAPSTNYTAIIGTDIPGFSRTGKWTSNGSTDGPVIYLGFRPKFVMVCRIDAAANMTIWDSARNPYNITSSWSELEPHSAAAESTGYPAPSFDFLSNGFKLRLGTAGWNLNDSGATFAYLAFAELPFKYSRAR